MASFWVGGRRQPSVAAFLGRINYLEQIMYQPPLLHRLDVDPEQSGARLHTRVLEFSVDYTKRRAQSWDSSQ